MRRAPNTQSGDWSGFAPVQQFRCGIDRFFPSRERHGRFRQLPGSADEFFSARLATSPTATPLPSLPSQLSSFYCGKARSATDSHHEIACRQRLQGRQRRASVPVGVTEQLTHARVGGGEEAVLLAASQEQEVRYVRLSSFRGVLLSSLILVCCLSPNFYRALTTYQCAFTIIF